MKRILLLLLLLPLLTEAQTISTFAGNGAAACCLDGGAAATAELYNPTGIAVDKIGNLYIADFGNSRIRKVNTSGIITTVAGSLLPGYSGDGGQATAAQLNQPWGVAVDTSGNIFISEYGNNVVRKVNTAGIITTFAGNGIVGYSGDGGHADSAEFHKPRGIAADRFGNIFIADPQNNAVRKVNASGIISTVAGNGTAGYTGDSIAATTAELNAPFGVAADNSGNLFIADWNNFRVRKVNASGTITTFAGTGTAGYSGDGMAATLARLIPAGISVDDSGNIYIPDDLNSVIRKVNAAGIITTIAGNGAPGYSGDGGPATAAMLHTPFGVAGNTYTNLFIADELNNRIRKVTWLFAASFTASADTVCQDSCVTFINYSTGSIDSIRWAISGVTLPNPHSDTINVCTLPAGNDTMKLYAYSGPIVDSSIHTVVTPVIPTIAIIKTSVIYFYPECIERDTLVAIVANGGPSPAYQWEINSIPIPGATDSFYTTDFHCHDSVSCIVSAGGTCNPTGSRFIRFWWESGVTSVRFSNSDISIFPNPATTMFTIQSTNQLINKVAVTNLLGQKVFTHNYNAEKVQVDVAGLPTGVYFIKVNGSEVRRFLKE